MIDPCQMCGSPVRIRRIRLPGTLAEPTGELVDDRKCTNRACASNTGGMTLADVV